MTSLNKAELISLKVFNLIVTLIDLILIKVVAILVTTF